ncbi:MAG: hypothetical protein A2Y12_16885 [Planctomycetes bacterium GWF2_42_9]|nr:MAG: hypothetical protein A2Y12_16885 [Planctomycetes bacterium GWF2_42_9]
MKNKRFLLSALKWTLEGYNPYEWKLFRSFETNSLAVSIVGSLDTKIPSSVQKVLLDNNIIKNWNIGLNSRDCEWIENRHWIFSTKIPDSWFFSGENHILKFKGLDYKGWIYFNGVELATFDNSHLEYELNLNGKFHKSDNVLSIVFDVSPRWLGQYGETSKMTDFKPRFNYTWDWCPRLVQIGIWDDIVLDVFEKDKINHFDIETDYIAEKKSGWLAIKGDIFGQSDTYLSVSLYDYQEKELLFDTKLDACLFNERGIVVGDLEVLPWWPNGMGFQNLYSLIIKLYDKEDNLIDIFCKHIGFKHIDWLPCKDAPKGATNWLCSINDQLVFLKGVNWTPIRPNFADVNIEDYQLRIDKYKNLGFNLFRVWGGAFLEKECFYDFCDRSGLMVWQELPLSSSGLESYPPDDPKSIEVVTKIAESFICRRKHHISLLMWCGGNELRASKKTDDPIEFDHPLIKELVNVFINKDPKRKFIPSTPFGPSFCAYEHNYGKGLHWAVNGPWKIDGTLEDWERYWRADDSLARTEIGCPGPSSTEIIEKYCGDIDPFPCNLENPLWARTPWWCEWKEFISENGRQPVDLNEYVAWGTNRQSKALVISIQNCLHRLGQCGIFIIWMGHDCFPCTANTSILDFEGNYKPAAYQIKKILTSD